MVTILQLGERRLDDQPADVLFITTITIAEMGFGIACLAKRKRRASLEAALADTVELFDERILPFDQSAALAYASLASGACKAGKGFLTPDGYIAALAAARGFAVATRDTAPLEAGGIAVINPCEQGA